MSREGLKQRVVERVSQPRVLLGCLESASRVIRNKEDEDGKRQSMRDEEKVVRIGDLAEWRQESRKQFMEKRASRRGVAQKCCGRQRQSS